MWNSRLYTLELVNQIECFSNFNEDYQESQDDSDISEADDVKPTVWLLFDAYNEKNKTIITFYYCKNEVKLRKENGRRQKFTKCIYLLGYRR